MRRALFVALASLAGVALALLWTGDRRQPNIVVILFDALRADRLGAYGSTRGLTPFMDELAARGVVFANAYSPSSWTVPAVASLFTSRYPSQHHVVTVSSKVSEREITLAEKLADAGYRTAGFSGNVFLQEQLGYGQGFSRWEVWHQPPKTRGEALRRHLLQWLGEPDVANSPQPRFLYVHSMDTHSPFWPPEPFRGRYVDPSANDAEIERVNALLLRLDFSRRTEAEIALIERLHDAEVAAADNELRILYQELQGRGVLDDAIVVVTADHGEELNDHGRLGHGSSLYEEVVRVPLIFVGSRINAGRRVERAVSLEDVAPTLLDLAGLPAAPQFEGRSLVPFLRPPRFGCASAAPEGEEPREIVFELAKTGSTFEIRRHSRGILRGSHKLLIGLTFRARSEVPELYDLATDPGEMHPNPDGLAGEAERLRASLDARIESIAGRSGPAEAGVLDEATKENLRALGYAP
jgi:arylsulfatase A-like enzyme